MLESINKLVANLGDNPYFGAGFGLVGVGAGLAAARQALAIGVLVFRRHHMMSLEITYKDSSYPWVLNWLTHYQKSAQHLSVVTEFHQRESGNFSSHFRYVPSPGTHLLRFNNKWIQVKRNREQTIVDMRQGLPFESIKFTCLGSDKKIFNDILTEALKHEASMHAGKTSIFLPRTEKWELFGDPRPKREFDSVVLDSNLAESILADVAEFLQSRDWYTQRGVPYRRGYLLHGPPGCGKTSFIMGLAGKLGYDICQMNLSDSALADDRFGYMMTVAPPGSFILLEDIDAAFRSRDDIDYNKPAYQGLGRLTLSGLLNVLDGVASSEGRILFMTTNYPERLDPALTRPGRVDMKIYIGYASDEQLARAFERFYPSQPNQPGGDDFVKAVCLAKDKFMTQGSQRLDLSMAEVQSYFLLFKDRPDLAISNLDDLFAAKLAILSSKSPQTKLIKQPV